LIAFLGGTFDPVHLGHLHAARTVRDALACAEVRLVLAARPSHRSTPVASIEDRWAMLRLAVAGEPGLVADDSEVNRGTPSYTIESLRAARDVRGPTVPLAWIVGWDAYRLLPTWKAWRSLLEVGHLVVVRRPGESDGLDPEVAAFTVAHRTHDPARLQRSPAGAVYVLEAGMLDVSASEIRARCGRGEAVAHLLPESVWTYICSNQLYGTEAPRLNVTPTSA
jgi:nicotinate-nucleotide adenylyltransferase